MAKMSFKIFEEIFLSDISQIIVNTLQYDPIKNEKLRFKKTNHSTQNYDVIYCAAGVSKKPTYLHKMVFKVYFSRRIYKIEKYIEPYLDLLLPFSVFSNYKYSSTFSISDDFVNENTLTYYFPPEVDFKQELERLNMFRKIGDEIKYSESYDYQLLKERLIYLNELGIQKLDAMSDIRVLDSLANATISDSLIQPSNRGATGAYYHKMIIAKLAENPIYEDIYRYFVNRIETVIEKQPSYLEEGKVYLQIVKQLYEDLKNVQPLENPMMI